MFDLCTASASSIRVHIRSQSVQSVRHSATTTHLRGKGQPSRGCAGQGKSMRGADEQWGARLCCASAIWKK